MIWKCIYFLLFPAEFFRISNSISVAKGKFKWSWMFSTLCTFGTSKGACLYLLGYLQRGDFFQNRLAGHKKMFRWRTAVTGKKAFSFFFSYIILQKYFLLSVSNSVCTLQRRMKKRKKGVRKETRGEISENYLNAWNLVWRQFDFWVFVLKSSWREFFSASKMKYIFWILTIFYVACYILWNIR